LSTNLSSDDGMWILLLELQQVYTHFPKQQSGYTGYNLQSFTKKMLKLGV